MRSLNGIKNKILRNELFRREKALRMKEKKQLRMKRKKDREALGDEVRAGGCMVTRPSSL